jgi:D-alanine-D-alanine ligase-like ATP-grasp enzyme
MGNSAATGMAGLKMLSEQLWRVFYRLRFYLGVTSVYRLLRYRDVRSAYYKELWQQAAHNIGAQFSPWEYGYFRIQRDGMTTFVKETVMLDDHLTLDIMGNKTLTYSLLREKGCAVPDHCSYTMRSFAKARDFMETHTGPLVVKPASGTGGGRGVTTGITNVSALRKASRLASRFNFNLLVEEHILGGSYRLLYLDGKYIDAVRRDPPVVIGDGRRTIGRLIKAENKNRLNALPVTALSPLTIDADCINTLRSQGMSPRSVPESGRSIEVKYAVNENCSSRNHSVKDQVHPDTVAQGARLARDFGVRVAGLDLICKDITVPLSPPDGYISEINTTPGIHHHYLVGEPSKAVPVAEIVLEHLFENRQGVMFLGHQLSTETIQAQGKPFGGQ